MCLSFCVRSPPLRDFKRIYTQTHSRTLTTHTWSTCLLYKNTLEPVYIPRAPDTGTRINRLWRWTVWPILFCRPTREHVLPNTRKKWGDNFEWMKLNGPGRLKLEIKKFPAVAVFWPTLGFRAETFDSSGFSTEGILISASAAGKSSHQRFS